jgi:hypothetical protein
MQRIKGNLCRNNAGRYAHCRAPASGKGRACKYGKIAKKNGCKRGR